MEKDFIQKWIKMGIIFEDHNSVILEEKVVLSPGCIIGAMTILKGNTFIGEGTQIEAFSYIKDSIIGPNSRIISSRIIDSQLESNNTVGPYAFIRGGTILQNKAQIGAYCEMNDTLFGEKSKSKHFSYIGHARIGSNSNVGAGTITCNYDGMNKHITIIEDDAFIGAGTLLIAPIKISKKARTGAGSVVTNNVEEETLVYGVPAKVKETRHKRCKSDTQGG